MTGLRGTGVKVGRGVGEGGGSLGSGVRVGKGVTEGRGITGVSVRLGVGEGDTTLQAVSKTSNQRSKCFRVGMSFGNNSFKA